VIAETVDLLSPQATGERTDLAGVSAFAPIRPAPSRPAA
jgi:hypothetical protein